MATEVEIIHLCDVCMAEGRKVRAEIDTYVGDPVRRVEACAEHAPPLAAALDMALRYGILLADMPGSPTEPKARQTPLYGSRGKQPRQTDPVEADCPKCGKRFNDSRSVRTHLRNTHRLSYQDYRAAVGLPPRRSSPPAPCPNCDFVAAAMQGLSAHRRSIHPTEWAAEHPQSNAGTLI